MALLQVSAESRKRFEEFWQQHTDRPWVARQKILGCLCPQIHGMPFVKLAALIMLIGGVQRIDETGTSIRGQVHLLIVGDPGTGTVQGVSPLLSWSVSFMATCKACLFEDKSKCQCQPLALHIWLLRPDLTLYKHQLVAVLTKGGSVLKCTL